MRPTDVLGAVDQATGYLVVGLVGAAGAVGAAVNGWRKNRIEGGDSIVAQFKNLADAQNNRIADQERRLTAQDDRLRAQDVRIAHLEEENEQCLKGRETLQRMYERTAKRLEHVESMLAKKQPG